MCTYSKVPHPRVQRVRCGSVFHMTQPLIYTAGTLWTSCETSRSSPRPRSCNKMTCTFCACTAWRSTFQTAPRCFPHFPPSCSRSLTTICGRCDGRNGKTQRTRQNCWNRNPPCGTSGLARWQIPEAWNSEVRCNAHRVHKCGIKIGWWRRFRMSWRGCAECPVTCFRCALSGSRSSLQSLKLGVPCMAVENCPWLMSFWLSTSSWLLCIAIRHCRVGRWVFVGNGKPTATPRWTCVRSSNLDSRLHYLDLNEGAVTYMQCVSHKVLQCKSYSRLEATSKILKTNPQLRCSWPGSSFRVTFTIMEILMMSRALSESFVFEPCKISQRTQQMLKSWHSKHLVLGRPNRISWVSSFLNSSETVIHIV